MPLELDFTQWHTAGRPGFAGKRRDQQDADRNSRYGPGNWRIAHEVSGKYYDWLEAITLFYEEAYFRYLQDHPKIADWLVREACDVYDNAKSNVQSGRDYLKQEAASNHMQDICIRRVIYRLGLTFEGKQLVQIRSKSSTGAKLSPGVIPYHEPAAIIQPELTGWWAPGSVEAFWQSNKVLLVRETEISASPGQE